MALKSFVWIHKIDFILFLQTLFFSSYLSSSRTSHECKNKEISSQDHKWMNEWMNVRVWEQDMKKKNFF